MNHAKEILSEILGLPVSEIADSASMTNTPGWDSLAHIEICSRVSEKTNSQISQEMIEACATLNGIEQFLRENQPS